MLVKMVMQILIDWNRWNLASKFFFVCIVLCYNIQLLILLPINPSASWDSDVQDLGSIGQERWCLFQLQIFFGGMVIPFHVNKMKKSMFNVDMQQCSTLKTTTQVLYVKIKHRKCPAKLFAFISQWTILDWSNFWGTKLFVTKPVDINC